MVAQNRRNSVRQRMRTVRTPCRTFPARPAFLEPYRSRRKGGRRPPSTPWPARSLRRTSRGPTAEAGTGLRGGDGIDHDGTPVDGACGGIARGEAASARHQGSHAYNTRITMAEGGPDRDGRDRGTAGRRVVACRHVSRTAAGLAGDRLRAVDDLDLAAEARPGGTRSPSRSRPPGPRAARLRRPLSGRARPS
jgi:hypothetical protein